MTYEQRWWSLDSEFWFTLAKIEEDEKYKDDPKIGMLISGTRALLEQACDDYQSHFEDHATFGALENEYKKLLSQIMGKLTEIQGRTKIIERVMVDQEMVG
jgi:hypothetical protein